MPYARKTLCLFLSAVLLWTSSGMDRALAHAVNAGGAAPLGGNFKGPQPIFSSGLELYRWISSFPDFSQNPALTAHVLIQSAPLIQKGPVRASREGSRIVLTPAQGEGEPFYIEMREGESLSERAVQLAQELQKAREADLKEGAASQTEGVLKSFYESAQLKGRGAAGGAALESLSKEPSLAAPAPDDSASRVWLILKEWIGKELNLEVPPERIEEWKNETARTLRNNPALPMEQALAESFARTHRLPSAQSQEINSLVQEIKFLLFGNLVRETIGQEALRAIFQFKGETYGQAFGGFYHKKNGRWELLSKDCYHYLWTPEKLYAVSGGKLYANKGDGFKQEAQDLENIYQILGWNGKLYARTGSGLYVQEGNRWEPLGLSNLEEVYQVAPLGEKLYVAERAGLHVKEKNRWTVEFPDVGAIYQIKEIKGKLYIASGNGLYVNRGDVWERELPGDVRQIIEFEGKLYAATGWGIEEKEGDKWRTAEFSGEVQRFIQAGDYLYAVAHDSLYVKKGESWELEIAEPVYQVLQWKGRLYARTPHELYMKEGDKWERELAGGVNFLHQIVELDGKLYAAFWDEFYVKDGDRWEKVSHDMGGVTQIVLLDGKFYTLAKSGLYLYQEGKWNREFSGEANFIAKLQGRLHVSSRRGIYVKKDGKWQFESIDDFASMGEILEHNGKLYAFAGAGTGDAKIYIKKGNRWEWELKNEGSPHSMVLTGGRLYVATYGGLYVAQGDHWEKILGQDRVHKVFPYHGQVYAAAESGIYAKKEGKWEIELSNKIHWGSNLFEREGKLYAVIHKEVYVKDGENQWERVLLNGSAIFDLFPAGKQIYAVTEGGLYLKKENEWELVIPDVGKIYMTPIPGWISGISVINERLYLWANGGVLSWDKPKDLPKNWQEILVKDIGGRIELLQKTDPGAPGGSFKPDEQGNILGDDGRTIFSGLQKGISLFLGILGAGALEGLSRLALSLGNLNLGFGESSQPEAAPGPAPSDPWAALERRLKESLELKIQPGRTEEWKKETAEVLRNEPGLSLEKALALGLARVHFLDPQAAEAAESSLRHGGSVFWKIPDIGIVRRFVFLDGKFYLGTSKGLFEWQKGGRPKPALEDVDVFDVAETGGKLHAFAGDVFYVREGSTWEKKDYGLPLRVGDERPRNIRYLNGKLHAVVDAGAYVHVYVSEPIQSLAGSWERLPGLPGLAQIRAHHDLFYLDGKLHESSDLGEFALEGDRWNRVLRAGFTDTSLNYAADIGGKRYAAGFGGFYVREPDRWKLLFDATGNFTHFAEVNGHIFLGGTDGLWQYETALFDSHADWKAKMLEEIAQRMERDRQSRKEPDSKAGPFSTDKKGNILGEDGWTIFSGVQKGISLVLGLLSVGALEGLSRLALSLGNLSLGFGMPAKGAAPSPKDDPWKSLERWVQEGLNLKLQPGKAEEWARETAEMLRNDPALSLEKALAEAFSKVKRLDEEKSRQLGKLFKGELVLESPDMPFLRRGKIPFDLKRVRYFSRSGRRLYVATYNALYVREGGRWRKIFNGITWRLRQIDGRTYLAAGRGLYELKGNGPEPVFEPSLMRNVYDIAKIRGRLYAATETGILVQGEKDWVKEPVGSSDEVFSVAEVNGKFYAAAKRGLYLKENGKWNPVFLKAGPVYQVFQLKGRLYAAPADGLYVREKSGWEPASKEFGWVWASVSKGGKVYLVKEGGLWSWTPAPIQDWQKHVLKEIGRRIEKAQKSGERDLAQKNPISTDGKGNIIGEDGRTIFSGFYKGMHLLLGMLGTGALEGLSRLALSLGNLNLGFDRSSQPADAQDPASSDSWISLEKLILDDLGLSDLASRVGDWKMEAARILRSDPALPLEKALSESFAKAHVLKGRDLGPMESLIFSGNLDKKIADLRGVGMVYQISLDKRIHYHSPQRDSMGTVYQTQEIKTGVYASTDSGLYFYSFKTGAWTRIYDKRVRSLAFEGESLVLGTDEGVVKRETNWVQAKHVPLGKVFHLGTGNMMLWTWRGIFRPAWHIGAEKGLYVPDSVHRDRWKPALRWVGSVYYAATIKEKTYAAAESGLYLYKKPWLGNFIDGLLPFLSEIFLPCRLLWKKVLKEAGAVYYVTEIGGRLHAAAEQGLYVQEDGKWRQEIADAGPVYAIFESYGKVYAGARTGLYVRDGKSWRLLRSGEVRQIARIGERIYLGTSRGVESLSGAEALASDWKESILKEIAQDIEQDGKIPPKTFQPPLSPDSKGNILGEDGRTLFGGE